MKQTPTVVETLGNLPAVRTTFYDDAKPALSVTAEQRAAFLTFKTDKEKNTVRRKMAVVVNLLTPSNIIHGSDKGTEFLQALVNDAQDSVLKLVADGKAEFETAQDYAKLIADYFDNSRSASGKRVTGEDVGKFFDALMAGWLTDKVIAKFPQFDAEKVAKVVGQYRQSFCDLAKYQMPHTKPVFQMIQKAYTEWMADSEEATTTESDLPEWISARLAKLNDRLNADEMLIDAI